MIARAGSIRKRAPAARVSQCTCVIPILPSAAEVQIYGRKTFTMFQPPSVHQHYKLQLGSFDPNLELLQNVTQELFRVFRSEEGRSLLKMFNDNSLNDWKRRRTKRHKYRLPRQHLGTHIS